MLFAVGISRFASYIDGLKRNLIADPAFVRILEQDLDSGKHQNPTDHADYFTAAFFHLPDKLESEIIETGFREPKANAIEGPVWQVAELDPVWADPKKQRNSASLNAPSRDGAFLLGASAHFMVLACK